MNSGQIEETLMLGVFSFTFMVGVYFAKGIVIVGIVSAAYRKTYIQNMYIFISYIQVKSLLAYSLCTIFVYTGKKCVS